MVAGSSKLLLILATKLDRKLKKRGACHRQLFRPIWTNLVWHPAATMYLITRQASGFIQGPHVLNEYGFDCPNLLIIHL